MAKKRTLDLDTIKQLIKLGFLDKPKKRKNGKRKKYKYTSRQILTAMKKREQMASDSGHMKGSSTIIQPPANNGQLIDSIKTSFENEKKAIKESDKSKAEKKFEIEDLKKELIIKLDEIIKKPPSITKSETTEPKYDVKSELEDLKKDFHT